MSEQPNYGCRRFLSAAAITIAAGPLVMVGAADAQPGNVNPANAVLSRQKTNTSFGTIKQINAGVLNVGYAEAGPADGTPVIFLHGWPYDIYSYIDVVPLLAAAGYRVIVPYLRGHGTTTFLSNSSQGKKVISSSFNRRLGTVSVLYGNDLALYGAG